MKKKRKEKKHSSMVNEIDTEIEIKGNGSKVIEKEITLARLLPININQGVYKLVLKTNDNLKNVTLSFKVKGEYGKPEKIEIKGINNGNSFIEINANRITNLNFHKEMLNEMVIKLGLSQRTLILVEVTE
jgi:hypothetical protein